ncbi:MAG: ParB/RepB/Spo0J family partition protein [Parcubacteria group bacterium]|nr:ParB/RepB/Spo0J family partition protein [Parcubacteria group bacterium]
MEYSSNNLENQSQNITPESNIGGYYDSTPLTTGDPPSPPQPPVVSLSNPFRIVNDPVEATPVRETTYNPHGYSSQEFSENNYLEPEKEEGSVPIPVFAHPNIALERVSYTLDPQLYAEPIKEPVFWIETSKIKSNPYQPRRHFDETALNELAESIKEYGILQPVVLSKVETMTPEGAQVEYQLIAGERRLLAARKIGLEHIPAVVKENQEERGKLEMAIIENLQREELNPVEMARAYARLSDEFALSQREISIRMGKSRESVANTIRLLGLPYEAQKAIEDKKLTESHARLMLRITNPEKQRAILAEILTRNLSVRETELVVSRIQTTLQTPQARRRVVDIDPAIVQLEHSLETVFGKPVSVERTGKKGKISISFYSDEELRELIERLVGQPVLAQQQEMQGMMAQGEPQFSDEEFKSELHES